MVDRHALLSSQRRVDCLTESFGDGVRLHRRKRPILITGTVVTDPKL